MSETLQMDEIKAYLKNHPEFFEENAAFLADIHLPSPHGGGTISLAERQQLAQRDKITALESRFSELVVNAQQNDSTANKMHAFNLRLHQAKSFDSIEQLISHDLPEMFDLSDTCLRIWVQPLEQSSQANLVFSEISEVAKTWVASRTQPYCGKPPAIVDEDWFIEPAASLAIIGLHQASLFGFLALASDSDSRFYEEMGTDFLNKMSELISAALSRHLALP
ncbi:MAG: DUF484 family protein [Methylotenera sp.]|nr:DUF484 family protein [Methylotenera sp.]